MLTRFIRNQLIVFAALTLAAIIALGWFYLRIPSQLGVGQYRLVAELPASGGLYRTSNVTYRGIQIGRVTKVEPTAHGVRATLSIDSRYKIPVDASANVHSVSAIGEQYLDLVSTGAPGKFFSPGQTITKGTVPSEIGPALDAANRGLSVLPKKKIASLLDETALAVGGLGPSLQRLVDSTQSIVGDFEANMSDVDDIIANSAPILDSQVDSGDSIAQWSHNLKVLTAQTAQTDQHVQSILSKAAPTADQVNNVFNDVRESLPQTLANLEVVADMLKRYNKGLEQLLVFLPEVGSVAQTLTASAPGSVLLNLNLWRKERTARSHRTLRPTGCGGGATIPGSTSPASARRPRGNAATTSRMCRWAPTRGTGIRTRFATARRRVLAATSRSTPERLCRLPRSTTA